MPPSTGIAESRGVGLTTTLTDDRTYSAVLHRVPGCGMKVDMAVPTSLYIPDLPVKGESFQLAALRYTRSGAFKQAHLIDDQGFVEMIVGSGMVSVRIHMCTARTSTSRQTSITRPACRCSNASGPLQSRLQHKLLLSRSESLREFSEAYGQVIPPRSPPTD